MTKHKVVQIGDKLVGEHQPVFIVAEIGINHNAGLDICKQMIDIAVDCGCDAVKFQKRTPEISVPEHQKDIVRETPWGVMTYLEYRHKIEFGEADYAEIDRYCKEKGIMWFASPWDPPSVDFLEQFNIPVYKIASASITYKDLLAKVKSTGKPVILSTGMSTMEQINKAVNFLGQENLIVLHCTSTYPSLDEHLDLNVIKTLKEMFDAPIGYSGHERGVYSSVLAAALGACVVERHITLDRAMYGSDQAASLERRGLEILVKEIRNIPVYLGQSTKRVFESEKPLIHKLRKFDDL
ncbi:MAG: N-acetylneuraminate synthase [Candidatus Colwellbacteria bacterium RIFCSPHIGHO2_02_FULL_45_17]|uniref:N-acetylneuraminate synthase n=1 Tax=Candidatus Colwellbacteria bacterium RIFCSPLOWO2_12_FULL_46_17 TaxID=1797695 RepID=A0A1G1ZDA1_9BACT|nr:MAG: N-acetylneuraminate synthase [Candidatus Colwellbacteria bacterium RIFCSPHIGHO2_02_FULL_45_17]OGY62591.1 MAG: N-acetylneuraminate synthase [Candidatus Colwellbacteria bacterium RIFCSPLOWO2_12_FULL_46_17]